MNLGSLFRVVVLEHLQLWMYEKCAAAEYNQFNDIPTGLSTSVLVTLSFFHPAEQIPPHSSTMPAAAVAFALVIVALDSGFDAPSFTYASDLILPATANAQLREVKYL